MAHGWSSVRLPHSAHGRTRSVTAISAEDRRTACSEGCCSKWKVRRWAVLRPIPGSLASSVISSSMALTGQTGGANGSG